MEIDPIDGGPKQVRPAPPPPPPRPPPPTVLHKEEEARQAIDMLRGDDVSARVAAAHRLDAVAEALGQERTRDVSMACVNVDDNDVTHACIW